MGSKKSLDDVVESIFWVVFGLVAFIILSGLVLIELAKAQDRGVGYYGMLSPSWPCKDSYQAFSKHSEIHLSVLWNTFGKDTSCLRKFIQDERLKSLEIHLVNEVCQKWGRCGKYEIFEGVNASAYRSNLDKPAKLAELRRYAKEAYDRIVPFLSQDTLCLVSFGLESNLDKRGAEIVKNLLRPMWESRCQVVWNPTGANGTNITSDLLEKHGDTPKVSAPCLVNLDGVDVAFPFRPAILPQYIAYSDIPAYFKRYEHCKVSYVWVSEFNGIQKGDFIDPRKRTNWPTPRLFQAAANSLQKSSTEIPEASWDKDREAQEIGCASLRPFADYRDGGRLAKQSDSHPGLVLLFGGDIKNRFSSVVIYHEAKKKEALTFSGWGNPDQAGQRQHWRSLTPAVKFPYNVIIKADKSCFHVENIKIRVD